MNAQKEVKLSGNNIRATFREFFNGKGNFMTPQTVRYGRSGHYIYELSKGEGFKGETIYGVTVLEVFADGTVKRPEKDLSLGGVTLEEAEAHIKTI